MTAIVSTYRFTELGPTERRAAFARPVARNRKDVAAAVEQIVEVVRTGGDQALLELTEALDKVTLSALEVSAGHREAAWNAVSDGAKAALRRAAQQIETFHTAQLPEPLELEVSPGVWCMRQARPIGRVGLYIPGGSAPLCSTVLMLGVPARIAGCPTRVLCTPPTADGTVDPHILVAAELAGVQKVYAVGGAQAIAAMAYGTESIDKVDKVFGPGNAWVTEAKAFCGRDVAVDMPAGPSEVLVIADEAANPAFVAADLLSQAEHGPDSHVLLVTSSQALADKVYTALEQRLGRLPRQAIAAESLAQGALIVVEDLSEALRLANEYAPEHLILQVEEPRKYVGAVRAAGSVFLGPWAPEAMGDYASGTNHVLPTYGWAVSFSGLSVDAFMTHVTFQELTPSGMRDLGPVVETLAELEGLEAHKQAVSLRLAELAK